mmetsp:Transcript_21426/g.50381  ORF Transcript_21426/g.50381 Transcript_21426/m.50381 type:complete len:379 (+) Transcript_21426:811-1947(+)
MFVCLLQSSLLFLPELSSFRLELHCLCNASVILALGKQNLSLLVRSLARLVLPCFHLLVAFSHAVCGSLESFHTLGVLSETRCSGLLSFDPLRLLPLLGIFPITQHICCSSVLRSCLRPLLRSIEHSGRGQKLCPLLQVGRNPLCVRGRISLGRTALLHFLVWNLAPADSSESEASNSIVVVTGLECFVCLRLRLLCLLNVFCFASLCLDSGSLLFFLKFGFLLLLALGLGCSCLPCCRGTSNGFLVGPKLLLEHADVGHHTLVVGGGEHVFHLQQAVYTPMLFSHVKSAFEVVSGSGLVERSQIDEVGVEAVDEGQESRSIPPTVFEVVDFKLRKRLEPPLHPLEECVSSLSQRERWCWRRCVLDALVAGGLRTACC